MERLLRKKDLHPELDMPRSTVADWIDEYRVYIPTVQKGNVTYYRPETIDVLKFIKECRAQNYSKPEIFELLAEKGFPITVEEAVEDMRKALDGGNYRDNFLTAMQTLGQATVQIADQQEEIRELQEKQDEQDETLKALREKEDERDGRIEDVEKRTEGIDEMKRELQALREELAATKEKLDQQEQKKGLFARLFR